MGFRVCWLAARGKSPDALRSELGLSVLAPIDGDFFFEQPFAGADLHRGWYGIFINDGDSEFLEQLSALSQEAEILACTVNETLMDCSSQKWRNGDRLWFVRHDAQQALDHLEVSGRPDPIRLEHLKEQALRRSEGDSDPPDNMFEVPVLMAFLETGFKHDRCFRKPPIFYELSSKRSPRSNRTTQVSPPKPFWKFW